MANIYKRVLIKLSGEALADRENNSILGAYNLNSVANVIKTLVAEGVEVAIVCGAGNIWRGRIAEDAGIDRCDADYMGMLGTIINSMALKSVLTRVGVKSKVLSALEMNRVVEFYTIDKAKKYMKKGNVVICAGGTGNPYFTTDTTASLRAVELECEAILMAKNGIDGVYTADPRKNKDAEFLPHLTYDEMFQRNLAVMDQSAISLCIGSNIVIRVFNMADYDNFYRVIRGDSIGTTIEKGE